MDFDPRNRCLRFGIKERRNSLTGSEGSGGGIGLELVADGCVNVFLVVTDWYLSDTALFDSKLVHGFVETWRMGKLATNLVEQVTVGQR